ncbi:ABC transporter permease [Xanthocytophaga agilis]|uniref:ABC transporter permease n=1 Tax=Xanthocytophaga agilis TaxID=3048010 RepID=A0AAE3UEI4_9BACT|nr:FtsX-like permease family protein [Xanthocytophaga agilis]MDJ1502813.1 ABC transporter permease [Xanthocytophaga agilis]
MLRNYITIAFRRLWVGRVYTLINVTGLALGIVCSMVIYVFLTYELSFDTFHSQSSHIFRIVEHNHKANGTQYWNTTAYPLAEAIRSDIPGSITAQTAGPISRIISSDDGKGNIRRFEEKKILFVDKYYLQLFDFQKVFDQKENGLWIAGSPQTAFNKPNAVILTQRSAEKYFPTEVSQKETLIGKTLKLNNTDELIISGIIQNPPVNTNLLFDLIVNYQFFKTNNPYKATNWSGNYEGTTYVLLDPTIQPSTFEKQLAALKKKYMKAEDDRRSSYFLQPLTDIHTQTQYGSLGSYTVQKELLWSLASLGVFLILIACINFINLTTAQAVKRSKEVGIRKAIGGTQLQLFFQFVSETFLIVVIAVGLSTVFLHWLLSSLNSYLTIIELDLQIDSTLIVFSILLCIIVSIIAGFYPAIVLTHYQPIKALKGVIKTGSYGLLLRKGLIIFQFGITYCLLVGMLIVAQQMDYFQHKDLGFVTEAVVTVKMPPNQTAMQQEQFRQRLLAHPSIKQVSYSSGAPTTANSYGTDFRLPSEPLTQMRQAEMKVVDLPYASLYNLTVLSGQWLSEANRMPDGQGFNGFVVNETLIKMLGLTPEKAVGQTLIISEGEAPIVGVVRDFHNTSLQQSIKPCVLLLWNKDFIEESSIRLQLPHNNPLAIQSTLAFIEDTWKEAFPEGVYQYAFLKDTLAKNYLVENLIFDAFRVFAVISIFISCLGLFGLITHTSEQRTKEIGIRKVLGASVQQIVLLLSGDFLWLIGIAFIATIPLIWYIMHEWLQKFTYKIEIRWWMFGLSGAIAFIIALATICVQAIRSALANPTQSLRSE